jgi:RNA polymerase sigma-70 factor (ECF subfamily)
MLQNLPDRTPELLLRARGGDQRALEELFETHLPALREWAAGRLPRCARDLVETADLIQDVALQTFRGLDRFQYRGEGSLNTFLRVAFMNRLKNEFRRRSRAGEQTTLDFDLPDTTASPAEVAARQELLGRYEAALSHLTHDERELVVCRLELGMSYQEIADYAGRPSPDATRLAVARSLIRLAEHLELA